MASGKKKKASVSKAEAPQDRPTGADLQADIAYWKDAVTALKKKNEAVWSGEGRKGYSFGKSLREIKDWQDIDPSSFPAFKMPADPGAALMARHLNPTVQLALATSNLELLRAQLRLAELLRFDFEDTLARRTENLSFRLKSAGKNPTAMSASEFNLSLSEETRKSLQSLRDNIRGMTTLHESIQRDIKSMMEIARRATKLQEQLEAEGQVSGQTELPVRVKGDDWERLAERTLETGRSESAQERQQLADVLKDPSLLDELSLDLQVQLVNRALDARKKAAGGNQSTEERQHLADALADALKNSRSFSELPAELRVQLIDRALEMGVPIPLRGKARSIDKVAAEHEKRWFSLRRLRQVWSSIYTILEREPWIKEDPDYEYLQDAYDNIQRLDHGYKMVVFQGDQTYSVNDAPMVATQLSAWERVLVSLRNFFPGTPAYFPQIPFTPSPSVPEGPDVAEQTKRAREKVVTEEIRRKKSTDALKEDVKKRRKEVVQEIAAAQELEEDPFNKARRAFLSAVGDLRSGASAVMLGLKAKIKEGSKQLSEFPTMEEWRAAKAELPEAEAAAFFYVNAIGPSFEERLTSLWREWSIKNAPMLASLDGDIRQAEVAIKSRLAELKRISPGADPRLDTRLRALESQRSQAVAARVAATDPRAIPQFRQLESSRDSSLEEYEELERRVKFLQGVVKATRRVSSQKDVVAASWYITPEVIDAARAHLTAVADVLEGLTNRRVLIALRYPAEFGGVPNIFAQGILSDNTEFSIDARTIGEIKRASAVLAEWTGYIKMLSVAMRPAEVSKTPGVFQLITYRERELSPGAGGGSSALDVENSEEARARRKLLSAQEAVWNAKFLRPALSTPRKAQIKEQPERTQVGDVVAVTAKSGASMGEFVGPSARRARYGKRVPLKRLVTSERDADTGELRGMKLTATGQRIVAQERADAARRWANMAERELIRISNDPLPPAPATLSAQEAVLWYENERETRRQVLDAERVRIREAEVSAGGTTHKSARNWMVIYPYLRPGARLPGGSMQILKKYGSLAPGGGWAGPFSRDTATAILQSDHGRKRGQQRAVDIKKTASFNTAFDLIEQAADAALSSGVSDARYIDRLEALKSRYGGDQSRWTELRRSTGILYDFFRRLDLGGLKSDAGELLLNVGAFRAMFRKEEAAGKFCGALRMLIQALGSAATLSLLGYKQKIDRVEDLVDTRVLTEDPEKKRPVGLACILGDVDQDWSSSRPSDQDWSSSRPSDQSSFHLRDNLGWLVEICRMAMMNGLVLEPASLQKFTDGLCEFIQDDSFYAKFYTPVEIVERVSGGNTVTRVYYTFRRGNPGGTPEEVEQYQAATEAFKGGDWLESARVAITQLSRYYAVLPEPLQHLYTVATNFYSGVTGNIPYMVNLPQLIRDPDNLGAALYIRAGLTAEQAGVDPVGLMRLFNEFNRNFLVIRYVSQSVLETEFRLNLLDAVSVYAKYKAKSKGRPRFWDDDDDDDDDDERDRNDYSHLKPEERRIMRKSGVRMFWVKPYSEEELAREQDRIERADKEADTIQAGINRLGEELTRATTAEDRAEIEERLQKLQKAHSKAKARMEPAKLVIKSVYPRVSEPLFDSEWWKLELPFTVNDSDDNPQPILRSHMIERAQEETGFGFGSGEREDDDDDDDSVYTDEES